jgi:hypothetical protein
MELKATVVARLPATPTPSAGTEADWGDVVIVPLQTGEGEPPLWAAYTIGMGFYDWEHGHLVAVYTHDGGDWREMATTTLTDCASYVDDGSLVQVQLEPGQVWLEVQSFTGAHSGCYDLLSFDGETLHHPVSHFNSSPEAGYTADLDGDGTLEVVLNWTENYIFCYACGVRLPMMDVLRWDGDQLATVLLSPLPDDSPADLLRLNNRAVELAQADLWKDALEAIGGAVALEPEEPQHASVVAWNDILIRLHADALAEEVSYGVYPLLNNVFYGDYEAAVDVMRPFTVEQIWGPDSPLVVGTAAEGSEVAVSEWISWTTNLAIPVQPDLAPAYFLRAWAAQLGDPGAAGVLADVERAADLDPGDPLYTQSLAYLKPPTPEPTPTKKPTPVPTPTKKPTPTPQASERWEVRTLLAGPGSPGRLYVLQVDAASSLWPHQPVRFLISDDYGEHWSPFPGGLPAQECVVNVNLDYATPDALYASTCQGLFRWSGSGWSLVSTQETGMVAIVYGQPQTIWATETFAAGAGVIRSDDGGASWKLAGSGLVSFNGVATVAIDPRDANTLYAIIWPAYGGSYLRRGTAAGQWQTMPTPNESDPIDYRITIDGATGALYVIVTSPPTRLWRTLNPTTPDLNAVQWEVVHDLGRDWQVELLASGWSPEGLAIYANFRPLDWKDASYAEVGDATLRRSLDGGHTWAPLPVP